MKNHKKTKQHLIGRCFMTCHFKSFVASSRMCIWRMVCSSVTKAGGYYSQTAKTCSDCEYKKKLNNVFSLTFLAFLPKLIWKMRSILAESAVRVTSARL